MGDGAYERFRCSLLGDRGTTGDRIPWFMRNGDGGVSPRSRLEKRRNIDTFLDSACCDSVAIIVHVLFLSWAGSFSSLGRGIKCSRQKELGNLCKQLDAPRQKQSNKARGTARTENLPGL
jgi:hypothetical protein